MARIIKYEFKKKRDRRELILWQSIARGGRAVLDSVTYNLADPASLALTEREIAALLPTRDS